MIPRGNLIVDREQMAPGAASRKNEVVFLAGASGCHVSFLPLDEAGILGVPGRFQHGMAGIHPGNNSVPS